MEGKSIVNYIIIAAAIILAFFLIKDCQGLTKQAEPEIQYRDNEIVRYKTIRDTLRIVQTKIKTEIKYVQQEATEAIEPIQSYTTEQNYTFLTERYGSDGIELLPTSIAINDEPIRKVITDVVRGDFAQKELYLTNTLVSSLEASITVQDSIIINHERNRVDLDGIIKKEKKKGLIYKILIPVAFGAGVLIAK